MLIVIIALLALAAVAISLLIVADRGGDAALPAEVEETIDEYVLAYEEADVARFEAIVTEDFEATDTILRRGIGSEEGEVLSPGAVVRGIPRMKLNFSELTENNSSWDIEHVGDPIVSGENPWFVTIEETWTLCGLRSEETGECAAITAYPDGNGTYAVIEENGVYRVAAHVWVGRIEMGTR